MKKSLITLIILVAICFQGCIVKSVHPFFKEENVVYRKELEGNWKDNDTNQWSIHQNPFKQNSYELHCTKNGREVALLGHLFTINNEMYFDMVPLEDNSQDLPVFDLHLIPTHSIAKVESLTDKNVVIKWFNEEWLREMFTQNKIRISHEMVTDVDPKSKEEGLYLLTASTDELQKFVAKYGSDPRAYDSDLKLQLTK